MNDIEVGRQCPSYAKDDEWVKRQEEPKCLPFEGDMAFLDLLHVEPNGRNRAIVVWVRYGLRSRARRPLFSLDSKFAPLQDRSSIAEGIAKCRRELTASTLNNDVLPAFCRPIIVTSISVDLWNPSQRTSKSACCHISLKLIV